MQGTTPKPGCESGWKLFDNHCYLIVEEFKTLDDASDYCGNISGYLIEIDTDAEYKFVEDHLIFSENSGHSWVGATYRVCGKKYKYMNSRKEVQWSFWAPGEPETRIDDNCVRMAWSKTDSIFIVPNMPNGHLEFFVDSCCRRKYFVCEKELD